MDKTDMMQGLKAFIETNNATNYGRVDEIKTDNLANIECLIQQITRFMAAKTKSQKEIDWSFSDEQKVMFSKKIVDAAYVMIAMSMFKFMLEQGVLTNEEYDEFVKEGENRWKKLLYGDTMSANRAELKEDDNEQKSSDLCSCIH